MRLEIGNIAVNPRTREQEKPHLRENRGDVVIWKGANRILQEQYPAVNSSGTKALFYYDYVDPDWVNFRRYFVRRFLGPGDTDQDPTGVLGKWAIRSHRIRVGLEVYMDNSEAAQVAMSFRAELWLLDQYFDYTAITWNNPPAYTGLKKQIDFGATLDAGDDASVNGYYPGRWGMTFDLPRLTADQRPVPLYGFAVKIADLAPGPEVLKTCYFDAELLEIGDDERIWQSDVTYASQAKWAQDADRLPLPYAGEYLPK